MLYDPSSHCLARGAWSQGLEVSCAWQPKRETRYDGGRARMKGTPPTPTFFVSADSKGLNYSVSPLQSPLTRGVGSVDFKGLRSLHNHEHSPSEFVLKAKGQAGLQRFWV